MTQKAALALEHTNGLTGCSVPGGSRCRASITVAGVAACSVLILVPCVWQKHIQAVDLPSHVYNAWLANSLRRHPVDGMALVLQRTNVLFDLLLQALLRLASPTGAERVAVAAAVLTFFWGAFAFVAAVNRRLCWSVTPFLAMLAYGWVFQMGFFNYYLSLGLSLAAAAVAWRPDMKRVAVAALMLVTASFANDMPVLWAIAALVYVNIARRLHGKARMALPIVAALGVVSLRLIVQRSFDCTWPVEQFGISLGVDQVLLYRHAYWWISAALLALWALAFLRAMKQWPSRLPADLIALSVFSVLMLPNSIQLPAYPARLFYLQPRATLITAILIVAGLAASFSRRIVLMSGTIALVFFGLVYADSNWLNRIEDAVSRSLARVPPNARVINGLFAPTERMPLLVHNLDRACIARCFSYGNYEPASGQFLVRATRNNPMVLSTPKEVDAVQDGQYVVTPRDMPIWQVTFCPGYGVCAKELRVGEPIRRFVIR